MPDIDDTLGGALSGLGAGVWKLQKPLDATLPAIVFTRVSEQSFIAHSSNRLMNMSRFQIVCMAATYAAMRTLVKAVEGALIANTTNFVLSVPLGGPSELPDSKEDGDIVASMRDYYIWSRP
jgi:hypothetical protein